MEKAEEEEPHVCYLLHHDVVKEFSATKLRVVFNGSLLVMGDESLNGYLLTRANLLPSLDDLLLRWRGMDMCS